MGVAWFRVIAIGCTCLVLLGVPRDTLAQSREDQRVRLLDQKPRNAAAEAESGAHVDRRRLLWTGLAGALVAGTMTSLAIASYRTRNDADGGIAPGGALALTGIGLGLWTWKAGGGLEPSGSVLDGFPIAYGALVGIAGTVGGFVAGLSLPKGSARPAAAALGSATCVVISVDIAWAWMR